MVKYLLSNFSLDMVDSKHYKPDVEVISEEEFNNLKEGAIPVMGNPAFARLFNVPCIKSYIKLQKGDVALVVGTDGGKLDYHATSLPDNLSLKYKKVEIVEAEV
ncbi:hypothetical protein [Methanobrevibacter sp.]